MIWVVFNITMKKFSPVILHFLLKFSYCKFSLFLFIPYSVQVRFFRSASYSFETRAPVPTNQNKRQDMLEIEYLNHFTILGVYWCILCKWKTKLNTWCFN